jgi:hypothetical protein
MTPLTPVWIWILLALFMLSSFWTLFSGELFMMNQNRRDDPVFYWIVAVTSIVVWLVPLLIYFFIRYGSKMYTIPNHLAVVPRSS